VASLISSRPFSNNTSRYVCNASKHRTGPRPIAHQDIRGKLEPLDGLITQSGALTQVLGQWVVLGKARVGRRGRNFMWVVKFHRVPDQQNPGRSVWTVVESEMHGP
jgi:hypothetical protein